MSEVVLDDRHLVGHRSDVFRPAGVTDRFEVLEVGGVVHVDAQWTAGLDNRRMPPDHAGRPEYDVGGLHERIDLTAVGCPNLHVGVGPVRAGCADQRHAAVGSELQGQVPRSDGWAGHLGAEWIEAEHQHPVAVHGSHPAILSAIASTVAAPRRVLIVTDDVLTASMAGPAIRAWEMARMLAQTHEVVLATTSPICELSTEEFSVAAADAARFAELERWCDVAVVQGYVLEWVPVLKNSKKVLVVDLYDPIFLEDLELNRDWPQPDRSRQVHNVVRVFREQVERGDFFLCASEKQRDMWLGFLSAAGRINPANYDRDPTLRALIDTVPFGLPDTPPRHSGQPAMKGVFPGIGQDDAVVLWGGGVYDWLDPLTAIRAVDRVRANHPAVRLFFLGVRHPNPYAKESRTLRAARTLAGGLGLTGSHVFFNETWVPYERRADFLLEADVGISLHEEHVETAYSFRTRILDCIWSGLPTVATAGDSFAEVIEREGLGRVVPGGDVEAVVSALDDLLSDPSAREECRANAGAVAPRYGWSEALDPLVRFCERSEPAADGLGVGSLPAGTDGPSAGRLKAGAVGLCRRGLVAYRRGGVRVLSAGATRAARRFIRRLV